jgi:glycosyltransferase involved in cell wall biosynthesis
MDVTQWAGAYAVELGRRYDIPVLITEHRGPFTLPKRAADAKRVRSALESAAAVATVSEHESHSIFGQGIRCSPTVVGNLIDDEVFTIRPSIGDGSANILTVSDSSPNKGLHIFLKAFALASSQLRDRVLRATIVSLTPLPESILNKARELGIIDRCRFLTGVPRHEMPSVYAECDLIVSMSITESFGLSIAEAMACGKPAICTRSGGPEDFVNDSNGYLVNVGDSAAIADRLTNVVENGFYNSPEEVRRSVVDRYGRVIFSERLDRLYGTAIKNFERNYS